MRGMQRVSAYAYALRPRDGKERAKDGTILPEFFEDGGGKIDVSQNHVGRHEDHICCSVACSGIGGPVSGMSVSSTFLWI